MDIVIISSFEKKIYILDVAWKAASRARNMGTHSHSRRAGAFALETCGRIRAGNMRAHSRWKRAGASALQT